MLINLLVPFVLQISLFPQKYFKSRFVEAHPSFNAWDLDTVDKAVNKTMQEIFLTPHKDDWDILISHLLGVDHCGHRYIYLHTYLSLFSFDWLYLTYG